MPKSGKRATMVDLAKMAEVDISTVSRALNGSSVVKENTRERILKIADEIGYVVNASARNLRKQSSRAIGIVIPLSPESGQTISDPFFLEMVGAVSHAASKRGFDLIVSVPQEETKVSEQRLLQTGRADGLIIIGQAGRDERLKNLGNEAKNIVVWGGSTENQTYTLVGSDNIEGGRTAAEHLLNLGRKRILFLGDRSLPEVELRYQGLVKAHSQKGMEHAPELILELDFSGLTAFEKLISFHKGGANFDAVFAASDVLAIAAIHALRACDLSVPDDVSVVGYDDIGQAKILTPSLTTINQNISLGGELLVDLLLKKVAGEKVESAVTPTKLIVRESCGGLK